MEASQAGARTEAGRAVNRDGQNPDSDQQALDVLRKPVGARVLHCPEHVDGHWETVTREDTRLAGRGEQLEGDVLELLVIQLVSCCATGTLIHGPFSSALWLPETVRSCPGLCARRG